MVTEKASPAALTSPEKWSMGRFPEFATQPLHIQTAIWRESMATLAALSQINAEWFRNLAGVDNPLDAIALTSGYIQDVFGKSEEEAARLTAALTPPRKKQG
ncbi:MAG: hypothetical protein QM682_00050 [Paracoccus sp. (in: a-proteobacteria)]|uniref:hypothetical protein n=1 Tax=Paracoccus sp. TaxID=267 RepID=UPI0039E70849